MRIAHIINPVKVTKDRDLYFQQPIVFKSMEKAAEFAEANGVDVHLYATHFKEDTDFVTKNIDMSLWNPTEYLTLSFTPSTKPARKLPYFKEILKRAYTATTYTATNGRTDLIIQTNADIILQPHFYLMVARLYQDGFDSFCINKRIIPENTGLKSVSDLPLLYCSQGSSHAGHDCFVFERSRLHEYEIGGIIMGTPWSEGTLIANMVYYSKKFYVFKHALATSHIGDRRIWLNKEHNPQRFHNTNETANIILKFHKQSPKFAKHETIRYLIGKLKQEVKGYGEKNYNDACIEIVNTL